MYLEMMEKAEATAKDIVQRFKVPSQLTLKTTEEIHRRDGVPCRRWSWRNQLLVAINGHSDARTQRQWEKVGRKIRWREQPFRVQFPVPVYGYSQTEGKPIEHGDSIVDRWLLQLPCRDVAQDWGWTVEAFNGVGAEIDGGAQPKGIALSSMSHFVWAHELIHASEYELGTQVEEPQHWRPELVANLGASTLLTVLGHEEDAEVSRCLMYIIINLNPLDLDIIEACESVLKRTAVAVGWILTTHELLKPEAEERSLIA